MAELSFGGIDVSKDRLDVLLLPGCAFRSAITRLVGLS